MHFYLLFLPVFVILLIVKYYTYMIEKQIKKAMRMPARYIHVLGFRNPMMVKFLSRNVI